MQIERVDLFGWKACHKELKDVGWSMEGGRADEVKVSKENNTGGPWWKKQKNLWINGIEIIKSWGKKG